MPVSAQFSPSRRPQSHGILVALLSIVWFLLSREIAARAATGFAGRVAGGAYVQLLASVFLLFLLALGFVLLASGRKPAASLRDLFSLPSRVTAVREWAVGAAVGWGLAIATVLPLILTGALYLQLWVDRRALLAALLSIATAALATLAIEVVFRGFAFRRLAEVIGQSWALLILSVLYAVVDTPASAGGISLLVAFLLGVLLANGWLRTHALWLPWGLHFGWNVALGAFFGLPINGSTDLATIIQAQLKGRGSPLGADLGPLGSLWAALVLLLGIAVVYRVSRDFAWAYTHAPIVAAGYAMDVPPPPAYAAMEAAAPPPPLVQILPNTPQDRSRTDT